MGLSPEIRSILEAFANAYPLSAHYRNGRKLRLPNLSELFPLMERDVETREAVLSALDELSRNGIASVRWKRFREGNEPDAVYLEDPGKLYELLGIPSPNKVKEGMLALLDERDRSASAGVEGTASDSGTLEGAEDTDPREARFRDALRAHLSADLPPPCGSVDELRDILILFRLPRRKTETNTVRNLSVRLFNDSKRIERLLPNADALSKRFFGFLLSEELCLKRSYPEAWFSFFGHIRFEDNRSWEGRGDLLALPLSAARALCGIELESDDALTIENKETFYAFCAGNSRKPSGMRYSCVIYTGGYPNNAIRLLIERIAGEGGRIRHFGDMDPEGLLIFQDIDRLAGGRLGTLRMDIDVYRRYLPYGSHFSAAAGTKLRLLTNPLILPLAAEMERTGIGVEQEVVSF